MKLPSIYEIFDEAAEHFPHRPAISAPRASLSYAELSDHTNRLANYLIAAGLSRGARIAILSDDPTEVIVSIIATLKAQSVFIPLDASLPPRRLSDMLAEVRPELIIAAPALFPLVGELLESAQLPVEVLSLRADDEGAGADDAGRVTGVGADALGGATASADGRPPLCRLPLDFHSFDDRTRPRLEYHPDQLAYIYFTSGSTGRPKAIAGRLKAIAHFIDWERRTLALDQTTRASQLIQPSFDAFLRDIFVPLSVGGCICVPPSRAVLLDAAALVHWLDRQRITLVHCVPSLWRTILNEPLTPQLFAALRYILLSGEPLLPTDVRRWMSVFGQRVQLVNLYGPTETTMTKFYYFVRAEDAERPFISIGKPMPGARALLLDEAGHACPPGAVGEIHIRTPYRTLGYLNQPELTQALFIPNPFGRDPDDILYKTGDLGRVLEDGNFQLLGRRDTQVKIRGVRIELEEVENLLRADDGVADVAVVAREESAGGDKYLCAYPVLRQGAELATVRSRLAAQLPAAMLPSVYVPLGALPRLPNGKLDRKALPLPGSRGEEGPEGEAVDEPSNETERRLVEIWQRVLKRERVGVSENFFEAGGHSLRAIQITSRILKEFGVRLELNTIFTHPTVKELARLVEGAARSAREQIAPAEPQPHYALSHAQRRLWILDQLADEQAAYNISGAYLLDGELDVSALGRAWKALVARHESLRTTFVTVGGEPRQLVHEAEAYPFSVDYAELSAADALAQARRAASEQAATAFDLATGPLLRALLMRVSERRHVFALTVHHIISDAWSMGVLIGEALELYDADLHERPSRLAPLRIQYKDYAEWQRQQLSEERAASHQRYWWGEFEAGAPVLELLTDYTRPVVKTYNGDRVGRELGAELGERLGQTARRGGASLFMLLVGAVAALLYRYTGQDEMVVGSPIAGRNDKELEGQVGFYVNMLALRARVRGEESFEALLGRVRETVLGAYEHQEYPFDRLVDDLQLRRDASRSPLFDVAVMLQNIDPQGTRTLEGVSVSSFDAENPVSKFDLTFSFRETAAGLHAQIEYNTDLFKRARIERMLNHLQVMLRAVASDPARAVRDLPLLDDAERHLLLEEWNRSDTDYDDRRAIHELFEEQVKRSPEAVALVSGEERISYRELNRRANQVAHHLRRRGVRAEVRVAILMERSVEMVAALLGVLKAGGAYLPLDPRSPRERLAFMLDDAAVSILLTQSGFVESLPERALEVICLDLDPSPVSAEPEHDLKNAALIDNLIAVLYTSGSTGRPKGTMIDGRGFLNMCLWYQSYYPFSERTRSLLMMVFSFDATFKNIVVPLMTGGQLILANPGYYDASILLKAIEEHQVNFINTTPSQMYSVLELSEAGNYESLASLDCLVLGGEGMSLSKLQGWFNSGAARCGLVNLYGPAECSDCVSAYQLSREEINTLEVMPAGRALNNGRMYVLSENYDLQPIGVAGELCVSGELLARGYWQRPGLTAEKFVPHPFREGERLYRTGDSARWRDDGLIEILGRIGYGQIKLRGMRVELGEVEAALCSHPAVSEALVVARAASASAPLRLVAYLVPAASAQLSASDLRAALRARLPDYMIPSDFVLMDALPLTSNGKRDRLRLPAPEEADSTLPASEADFVPASTERQQLLADTWSSVLGRSPIGLNDSYFDLGGDSIQAIQIASRLRQHGWEMKVRDLFRHPTVADLAERLRSARQHSDQSSVVGEVRTTPIQRWFLESSSPGQHHHFNHAVMLRAAEPLSREAVETIFRHLLRHHDALRLTLRGDVLYNSGEELTAEVEEFDWRAEEGVAARLSAEADRVQGSIDLARGPLVKLALFHLPEDDRLLIIFHHLVIDGVSWRILFDDMETLYGQWRRGEELRLSPKTDSFKMWSESLHAYATDARLLAERDYWLEVERAPVTELARDWPDGSNLLRDEQEVRFQLDEEQTRRLRERANHAFNTETGELLLTGLGLAVAASGGGEQVAVQLDEHGRDHEESSGLDFGRTVGWFTAQYPVVLDMSYGGELGRQVKEVKERVRSVPGKGIGYGLLRYVTPPELVGGVRFSLEPQLFFNYHGQHEARQRETALSIAHEKPGRMQGPESRRLHDLEVSAIIAGGRLRVSLRYSERRYRPERMSQLMRRFEEQLLAVIDYCAERERTERTPSDLTYKGLSVETLDSLFDTELS